MSGNNSVIGGGGFHHLGLKVKDFDASMKFYKEGLGFAVYRAWGEGDGRAAMLDTGDGNYFEILSGGSDGEKPEGVFAHLALRTENCDLALKKAVEAGAVVTKEPSDVTLPSTPPLPVRIAFCKGPDGEILEFFQNR